MEVVVNKLHSYLLYKTVICVLKVATCEMLLIKIYVIGHFFISSIFVLFSGVFLKIYIAKIRSSHIYLFQKMQALTRVGNFMVYYMYFKML